MKSATVHRIEVTDTATKANYYISITNESGNVMIWNENSQVTGAWIGNLYDVNRAWLNKNDNLLQYYITHGLLLHPGTLPCGTTVGIVIALSVEKHFMNIPKALNVEMYRLYYASKCKVEINDE